MGLIKPDAEAGFIRYMLTHSSLEKTVGNYLKSQIHYTTGPDTVSSMRKKEKINKIVLYTDKSMPPQSIVKTTDYCNAFETSNF